MSRRLQHRDISDPIARIVRGHLDQLDVAAIHHVPLIRDLTSEVLEVVARAQAEAYADGQADAAKEVTS